MEYFDLHCDTLYKATVLNQSSPDLKYHIRFENNCLFDNWNQLFAIWIPDELKREDSTSLFLKACDVFNNNFSDLNNTSFKLAVENASMLAGSIDNISLLTENKVVSVTLTWNGENELGCGSECRTDTGLSTFGSDVVKKLEESKIAVDLSHASDKLFFDVSKIAKKPFFASHSNSRTITNVKRNLTDDQFKIIRDFKGIVGLNFYKGFLNNDENNACIDDIVRHAEYFLNLGGEHTLAIGSDFDGADMPYDIRGIETVPKIYNRFLAEFGEKITKNIFYNNANIYFANFDNNS